MSDYNAGVVTRLTAAIQAFEHGRLSFDEIQVALQTAIQLLESDGSGFSELVRLAEADLEEIRFTLLLAEQRPAVVIRLGRLQELLLTKEAD